MLNILTTAYWCYNRIFRRPIVLRTVPGDGYVTVPTLYCRVYYGQRIVLVLPAFLFFENADRVEASVRARFEAHPGYTPLVLVRFAEWKPITAE